MEVKNYKVKALRDFNDYEGKDVNNKSNTFIIRKKGDIFNVSEKRFKFLVENNAIESNPLEITPIEENVPQENKKKTTRKTTKNKDNK